MTKFDILWTYEAENDLDDIFEYYSQKSALAAYRIINDIIESVENLIFQINIRSMLIKQNAVEL